MNIMLMVGSNAPVRNAVLKVVPSYMGYCAYWDEGYCGCEDCRCITGWGKTPEEAIADYWERWEEL